MDSIYYRALNRIKGYIRDDSLSDPECFQQMCIRDRYLSLFLKFHSFIIESPFRHAAGFCCQPEGYLFVAPRFMYFVEVIGQGQSWSAELHAARFGCDNALGLPLAEDVYKRQHPSWRIATIRITGGSSFP